MLITAKESKCDGYEGETREDETAKPRNGETATGRAVAFLDTPSTNGRKYLLSLL